MKIMVKLLTSLRMAEKIEIGEKKERIANVLNGIALRSADYLAADGGAGNPGEGDDAGRSCVLLPEACGQGW